MFFLLFGVFSEAFAQLCSCSYSSGSDMVVRFEYYTLNGSCSSPQSGYAYVEVVYQGEVVITDYFDMSAAASQCSLFNGGSE